MTVTYRVIERYSKRRFTTSKSSSSVWFLSSKSTSVWSAWSARSPVNDSKNWVLEHLSSLFGLSGRSRVQSAVQEWLYSVVFCRIFRVMVANLTFGAYLSYIWAYVATVLAVTSWIVKRALLCCFRCNSIVLTTRINRELYGNIAEANKSCLSVTVYLICTGNVFKTRQAILDGIDAEPSLNLICQSKLMGTLQIWRCCQSADVGRYSLVRELSPVWNRELVTQDTVHDYVTDVIGRSDVTESPERPPWRIYLIPLAFDPRAADDCSTCCLVAQCHRFLSVAVDSLVRRALNTQRSDALPGNERYRMLSVQRSISTGSHAPAVSWTKAIPRADFIDRVCLLAGTTIRELFLAAFSQSLNQCYNQSGLSNNSGHVKIEYDATDKHYSLPLGTPLLEDGQLVLAMLKSQRLEAHEKMHCVTALESRYVHREHKSRMHDEPAVSVGMETAFANSELTSAGIEAAFRWTYPRSLSVPIRLGLWIGNSSVRLGLMQHPHPALVRCPLRTEEIERRVYQLAASFGVQAGRPLSPHSTPLSTPGSSPPPTPRPR